jgi:pyruvate kinase
MIKNGMNIARLNFSYGTYEEHKRAINIIRSGARKYDAPVAILQDLKGLKIRIGHIKNGSVKVKEGSTLALTAKKITGDSEQIQIAYPRLVRELKTGDIVLIDDGLIQLTVIRKEKNILIAEVMEGGLLKEKKGVNFPGVRISDPTFTKKDIDDLSLGIKLGVDYIALSFVRSRADILRVKRWLNKNNEDVPVIAKIENRQAIENIEEIIDASDGLMIARGDLGVEVAPEEVPLIQKSLINRCNSALKPVITATQMLESMTNAVLDGTDALMLSAETSVGKYPIKALKMMDTIIKYTETHKIGNSYSDIIAKSFPQAVAGAACSSAMAIKAKTIVTFSQSGFTALLASKFRPVVPVTAFTVSDEIRRRMNLYWGIAPYVMKFPGNTDEMISESEKALLRKGIVKKGDPIVIIAASPFALGSKTNIMKLHKVGA